jgi:hypothetical protein
MINVKQLTRKQLAIIDDLFEGRLDEQQVLEKHKVDRRLYHKWLADDDFTEEFGRRLAAARRQSELITARYAAFAAAKLVQLTESENQETARKACLDIIGLLREGKPAAQNQDSDEPDNAPDELPPELASRLLTALAVSNESRITSDK